MVLPPYSKILHFFTFILMHMTVIVLFHFVFFFYLLFLPLAPSLYTIPLWDTVRSLSVRILRTMLCYVCFYIPRFNKKKKPGIWCILDLSTAIVCFQYPSLNPSPAYPSTVRPLRATAVFSTLLPVLAWCHKQSKY